MAQLIPIIHTHNGGRGNCSPLPAHNGLTKQRFRTFRGRESCSFWGLIKLSMHFNNVVTNLRNNNNSMALRLCVETLTDDSNFRLDEDGECQDIVEFRVREVLGSLAHYYKETSCFFGRGEQKPTGELTSIIACVRLLRSHHVVDCGEAHDSCPRGPRRQPRLFQEAPVISCSTEQRLSLGAMSFSERCILL